MNIKALIILLACTLLSVDIYGMDFIVISGSGAKSQNFSSSEDIKKWEPSSYSKETCAVIKNMMDKIGISNISDVTAVKLTPDLIVRHRKEFKRTVIDPETFMEKCIVEYADYGISHRLIEISIRVGKKNKNFNTSDFPIELQKDIYKMWLRFESGKP